MLLSKNSEITPSKISWKTLEIRRTACFFEGGVLKKDDRWSLKKEICPLDGLTSWQLTFKTKRVYVVISTT